MIVLDNDILVRLGQADPDPVVVEHLQQYSTDEWTIPAIVAFEFYKSCENRTEMEQARNHLSSHLDRIVDFTSRTALEAAYLDERLREDGVSLDPADLLNVATAHAEGGTFVTHNKHDFDKPPLRELVDVDVVLSR
ncbi:type II toxin-antitoxin system VapC family toxin [Halorussus lipolyticus]|uniref:type II toxin-antitoxin system VapC family toxin n=1 Tax=Halorussus lipolyticus TaxID=3034024 RepID=UPI0023E8AE5C|nr:type II toxin-antitoxin system VapC family toxin [Halorussus sp. DT80]